MPACWSPAVMRTDWAGSSMHIDPIRPEYAETSRPDPAALHNGELPTSASDPATVARLVLEVAAMAEPAAATAGRDGA